MKKLGLFAFISLFSLNMMAQSFNAGVNAAFPIGDAGDLTTFGFGLEANYLWEISDEFDLGATAGYFHYFGDKFDYPSFDPTTIPFTEITETLDLDDISFLPIAAAARYNVSDKFVLGADLGYALGLSDGADGGFYYAPKVQYNVTETIGIVLAYRGVSTKLAIPTAPTVDDLLDAAGIELGKSSGTFGALTLGVQFKFE